MSPAREILASRWQALISASTEAEATSLFHDTRDSKWRRFKEPFWGDDTTKYSAALEKEHGQPATSIPVGFRSFDNHLVIPDHRLIHDGRAPLWEARIPGQVFIVEQHSHPIEDGPGLVFTGLVPDMHHFNGRGGRALPLLHPDGTPNLAPGLLDALAASVGLEITHEDVLAYIAGVVSHPGFTATFEDELTTPGVRVPITKDPALWTRAVELGREVVWLHTYGDAFIDKAEGREESNVRSNWPAAMQPLALEPVKEMPIKLFYDDQKHTIYFTGEAGERNGEWGPVSKDVFDYTVGGMNVIGSWFKYRKKNPGGKKTSPLDDIHVTEWPHEWTLEFTELLTVLARLVSLEPDQKALLDDILAGELSTMGELADAGVKWPQTRDDRKPRRKPVEGDPTQLDIPEE